MGYRAELVGHGLTQFHELQRNPVAAQALLDRIVRLTEEPWDAWLVKPTGELSAFRETTFGDRRNGLISYVDDTAEMIQIFNLIWLD